MKKILSKYSLFLVATVLLWLKTYIVYNLAFDIELENKMESFILFINPLSSVLLFLGFSLFASPKLRNRMIVLVSLIGSFILFANVVYYREFTDFITIPLLFQTNNMADLGSSITSLIHPTDVLLFADVLVMAVALPFLKLKTYQVKKKEIALVFATAITMFAVNVGLAETERPQLLTRTFDREMLVKYIGTFNYHVYDAVLQSKAKAQRAFADGSEIVDIENYVRANHEEPDPKMFGIAKDKNVVLISMESLQNFVINEKVNGQEITPFLNDLVKDSYYFPNFYHQTAQGKTSDSEFILENSMYGLPSGAVFFTHAGNQFPNASPKMMGENGYYSAVFHPNNKSFWNRDVMYDSLGYNKFYDIDSFSVTPENSIGWGLKDEYFFDQSVKYLKTLPEPYYAKYITLTNHFPFSLKQEDEIIPEWNSEDGTVNRYFTTVRYMDESIKKFFERLKEEGMYEDSIFILYGDHYGISENHNEAMSKFLGKEITPYESAQLQKVPLFIHIPGQKGKVMDQVAGQIDLKPTIMHLLGIDTKNTIKFGNDLFAKNQDNFVIFRDGGFVTKDYVYTKSTCYNADGTEAEDKSVCEPYADRAKTELEYSDKIIYGDLLRFLGNEQNQTGKVNNE
ncbi:LTA synthase family protein [Pseudalkalibacillus caeni]|uniref:LTA synthase family protein n=1 Tax=Exobacillus caeni TaxID=2574798 RepID=A0A5R9F9E4_9BACL|nr:LTA synthase family protein [Pseudalkalibacillus caeni]TLS36325.1 LTA synthase family protein [Pseudalkalibacillus caeni]